MNLKQAYALLKEKLSSRPAIEDEDEARKLVDDDQLKKIEEQKQFDREERTRKITELGKRFPQSPNQIFSECWKCKDQINFDGSSEIIRRPNRVIRLSICPNCNSINIEVIFEMNMKVSTKYDRFLGLKDRGY